MYYSKCMKHLDLMVLNKSIFPKIPTITFTLTKGDEVEEFDSWVDLVSEVKDWRGIGDKLQSNWREIETPRMDFDDFCHEFDNMFEACGECEWKLVRVVKN